ncbi:MAG: hypothetical protein H6Q90_3758 [Deltaproteobacteria bacterium]|nr:hypothetical protein [Deltaproteobacteria bacterium]
MVRSTVLVLIVATLGCDGVLQEKPFGGEVDAGALSQVQPPPCDQPATPTSDGHHFVGEDCLSCHHQGGMDMAPPFTFAGTMYDSSGGTMPLAGATFHLIDALGTDIIVQSQTNGNFYSTDLVTFPVIAFSSLCPQVIPMVTPIGELDGSCNSAGCHTSGFRLH